MLSALGSLKDTAEALNSTVYPYTNLEDFESFRSLAISNPEDAGIRLRMKSGSKTTAIVRIYYGPPGTGKTLAAVKDAVSIVDKDFAGNFDEAFDKFNQLHTHCCFLTFHPSLQYQDIVESIRPVLSGPKNQQSGSDWGGSFGSIASESSATYEALNAEADHSIIDEDGEAINDLGVVGTDIRIDAASPHQNM